MTEIRCNRSFVPGRLSLVVTVLWGLGLGFRNSGGLGRLAASFRPLGLGVVGLSLSVSHSLSFNH